MQTFLNNELGLANKTGILKTMSMTIGAIMYNSPFLAAGAGEGIWKALRAYISSNRSMDPDTLRHFEEQTILMVGLGGSKKNYHTAINKKRF